MLEETAPKLTIKLGRASMENHLVSYEWSNKKVLVGDNAGYLWGEEIQKSSERNTSEGDSDLLEVN